MAPRRETSAREWARSGAELCAGVEEDVEKKRHVKDPFREAYVALVAAPFDAFLAKHARDGDDHGDEDDADVDMERGESDNRSDETEDHAALQQEISARSQQVHLRLEILRRQMQSLVEESSAVLDSEDTASLKKETNTRKKSPILPEPVGGQSGDESMINLEKLLERAALYESGELTDIELQKTWHRYLCPHVKHEVVGADEKFASMRATMEEDFQTICEQNLLYFGPRLPNANAASSSTEQDAQMAQFLQDCKRSIKPFFLEDFVVDIEASQPDQDSTNHDTAISPGVEDANSPTQTWASAAFPDDDVTMRDVDSLPSVSARVVESTAKPVIGELQCSQRSLSDDISGRAIEPRQQRFCVQTIRMRRNANHKKATDIKADCRVFEKLPVHMSRQSVDSSRFSKRLVGSTRPPPLALNTKEWGNLHMSVIDSDVNLVNLRYTLSLHNGEPLDEEEVIEPTTRSFIGPTSQPFIPCNVDTESQESLTPRVPVQTIPPQTKRQLDNVGELQQKKPRVSEVAKSHRPLSLRTMVKSIRDVFCRLAHTSCVSYLSTLLRSGMSPCTPQRAFVALVFSASLANTTEETAENHIDKPLRIALQSANGGRDVKITCCQE